MVQKTPKNPVLNQFVSELLSLGVVIFFISLILILACYCIWESVLYFLCFVVYVQVKL